ncbi:MAG: MarR family transcriptional regulator [Ardenticatenales bacterium]|nr:MarR family transcriptional regulator [Ardenticatenales bacterium]
MNEMEVAAHIIEVVPYLSRTIAAEARQTLGDGWFTLVHVRVLAHIRRSGGCSLGDLAERRGVSLPTMSKMVSSLVDKGLITREPDPTNRRAVIIRLTEAGDQLYMEVLTKLQRNVAADLEKLTAQQCADIVSSLEALADVMTSMGEVRQHLHLPVDPEEVSFAP